MSGIKRNVVTSAPTTLQEGHEVFYNKDGTYTHYIGNSSNEPVPAKGYLEYVAILSQSGTDDPTVNVLVNDFDSNITWTRDTIGVYNGALNGGFTLNKTVCHISTGTGNDSSINAVVSESYIEINTQGYDEVDSGDSILNNTSILIRVYP
jgi:hypothetical protein